MNRRCRCFSLIEVVVALGLGVLLVTCVQFLVVRSYRTAQQLAADLDASGLRQLPFDLWRADLAEQPALGGIELKDNVLTLDTLCDLEANSTAIRHSVRARYFAQNAEGRLRLLRSQREIGDRNKWPPGVILADNLRAIEFGVFSGKSWQDRWPPSVVRPAKAVRLQLQWSDGFRCEEVVPLGMLEWKSHRD